MYCIGNSYSIIAATLGVGIGIGYLNKDCSQKGSSIFIKIRKKMRKAKIVKAPFYSKGTSVEVQNTWSKRLNFYYPSLKLVPLLSEEAKFATVALLWKAPLSYLNKMTRIKGLISLGQGVDHILNGSLIPENIPVVRIVDPYMAKSMSHWVLLSILNIIRETYGYFNQENTKLYKPRDKKNFLS